MTGQSGLLALQPERQQFPLETAWISMCDYCLTLGWLGEEDAGQ